MTSLEVEISKLPGQMLLQKQAIDAVGHELSGIRAEVQRLHETITALTEAITSLSQRLPPREG